MAHIINTKVKSGNVLVLSGSSVEISGALKTTSTVTASGGFTGDLAGNASTATALQTARTLTIGSTGKSFDGTANVAWTLTELGAVGTSANNTFTGVNTFNTNYITGSITGSDAKFTSITGTLNGNITGNAATVTNGVYTTTIATVATTGVTAGNGLTGGGTVGVLTLNVGAGTGITVAADTVGIDTAAVVTITGSQTLTGAKTFSAATTTFAAVTGTQAQFTAVTGALVGNASTATSAATWTTARTLTIGGTGKSVNGSADVSWTLTELGAVGLSSNNTFTGNNTFNGAFAVSVASTATAYSVTATDHVILATAGPYTITVPTPVGNTGRKLIFKRADALETTLTLSASVGTIDGSTFELNGPYQSVTLVSNGSNWFVL